jgi:hypothetical protein
MTVAVSDTPRLGTEFQLYLSTPATPVDRHIGVISCSMCNANSKALLLFLLLQLCKSKMRRSCMQDREGFSFLMGRKNPRSGIYLARASPKDPTDSHLSRSPFPKSFNMCS